jgi:xanthine dehydrogenase YagR molybdenum-binding subunit
MYEAANRRTRVRIDAVDVPVNFWMRAPGVAPGMYAAEVAMDELAVAWAIDPVEVRIRNEPRTDPKTGNPWSGRRFIECLRLGADRFGWAGRNPVPRKRISGEWLCSTGMAASTYPAITLRGNAARVEYGANGKYVVQIGAADI